MPPFRVVPPFLSILLLAGCSSRPSELVAPLRMATESSAVAPIVEAPPSDPSRWAAPRLTVISGSWRVSQEGVFPANVADLAVAADQPVDLRWSAHALSKPGVKIVAFRWAVDLADITDETPRADANDLAHWSAWSATEKSVTLAPAAGTRLFHVEVRDGVGILSLVSVRLSADEANPTRPR